VYRGLPRLIVMVALDIFGDITLPGLASIYIAGWIG